MSLERKVNIGMLKKKKKEKRKKEKKKKKKKEKYKRKKIYLLNIGAELHLSLRQKDISLEEAVLLFVRLLLVVN